ncbi:MAG: MMPL family transporter [Deltaproteobacteria bacterium]|nr:MMPL family transporter [Deltaproteobacteria bacterium]MCB9787485.1 MMPL family transporter [Deltaproteobacteria bacterium]
MRVEGEDTLFGKLATWVVRLVERRPWAIVAVSLAFLVGSVWLATGLRVDDDLKVLLPPDAESIARLEALKARMGNQSDLVVVVESPSREANLAFGAAIAERLEARDDIRFVVFRRDRTFFEDNLLLYLGLPDLLDLRQRVKQRIQEEVRNELSLGFDDDEDEAPEGAATGKAAETDDPLDMGEDQLRERYGIDERMPEYFEAEEGRVVVVTARPTIGTTDVSFARKLVAGVEADIAAAGPASFHPEMSVRLEGAYPNRLGNISTIAGDAARGGAAAAVLLVLCLWFYFGRLRAVPLVMIPLVTSVVAALAYAALRYGFLNLVSAFIFAVLLGMGIDFGIHILGRYENERRRGFERPEAMRIALGTTGASTSAGAFSTIGVYLCLMVAEFQGFAQFGELAAVGVLLALVGVIVVLPAVTTVVERWRPWKPLRRDQARAAATPPPRVRRFRYPARTMAVAAVVAVVGLGTAGYAALHLDRVEFEYDFSKLGPEKAPGDQDADNEAAAWKDAVGKETTLSPVVALTENREQTEATHRLLADLAAMTEEQAAQIEAIRAAAEAGVPYLLPSEVAARAEQAADGGEAGAAAGAERQDVIDSDAGGGIAPEARFEALGRSAAGVGGLSHETLERLSPLSADRIRLMQRSLAQVFSIFSFVPDRQQDKLLVIRDIRSRIERKRGALSKETQDRLDETFHYLEVDEPVGVEDLPQWITQQFRDEQGHVDRFVLFRNHGSKADYAVAKEVQVGFFDLPTSAGVVPTSGNVYVMPEVMDTVKADGPLVVALAVGVVMLTAIVMFQSVSGFLAVVVTVMLSVLWLLGLMILLGWKANFFNIIAVPLLLGMGQDYAIHIYHRYESEGPGRLRRVLRETGGAVFMTTLTTVFGFGGILFANHRGLLSLGWISVLGLVLCFIGAVAMLPALLVLRDGIAARLSHAEAGDPEEP